MVVVETDEDKVDFVVGVVAGRAHLSRRDAHAHRSRARLVLVHIQEVDAVGGRAVAPFRRLDQRIAARAFDRVGKR